MPIGDLLASISGGPGKASAPGRPNPTANIKRKASGELASGASKARRVTPPPSKLNPNTRPSSDRASSSAAAGQPYTGTATGRPAGSTPGAPPTTISRRPQPALSSAAAPRTAPKKGSFAEILARGKAAQVSMGQVGKIQHKKVEKPPKRSKEELQAAAAAATAAREKKAAAASTGYGGTSRPLQRPAGTGNGGPRRPGASSSLSRQRSVTAPGSARRGPAAAAVEPGKRVKKAATATTGYAGTARPKPDAVDGKKRHHDAPRGGALLSAPKVRAHQHDEEYDEDMDDFIDYDDDDDDGRGDGRPTGYDYNSDASEDMEAGIDDIDDEEDRAARIARLEDVREERLEKSLKAAKEERRRRAYGDYR
ncbi:Chromatin SPT2 [Cordyceps militaris CM01]|uniref:Chromatin SPT2 n=1 Tax=Cordyceps militaris (strain CM01) TaxID=983644 RepID=G3JMH2_CORMM|nr:Chromatin SPT2 [Cordyceps militaris CM01]EGX90851.1 Chromatin SPT2 [Cordyceps militaris CM01]